MRNSTKLKKILEDNTIGLSTSNHNWQMSIINFKTKERYQVEGKSFTEVINKAFKQYGIGRRRL